MSKNNIIGIIGISVFVVFFVGQFFYYGAQRESDKSKSKMESHDDAQESPKNTILYEEQPPIESVKIDIGKLTMNRDGHSVGNKTELTELLKRLNNKENKDVQLFTISWIWESSGYPDMGMELTYDKKHGTLKQFFTQNNVIEEYSNISPKCLTAFLKSGEKSLYSIEKFCKDSKYDFNNREMSIAAVGKAPHQSELDGAVSEVKEYIKSGAYNASSIKFIEWSKVVPSDEYWVVRCKYKGKNAFGDVVAENVWFYMQNNKVIKTKSIVD